MNILLINQNFYPDISATGQYLTDLALSLKKEGHSVTVLCSRRSYLDHEQLYDKDETFNGITIRRIWTPGVKRDGKLKRVLQALCYSLSFFARYLFTPKHDRIVVLTSPPLLHWSIAAANMFKQAHLIHWAMDINPEQAIRTGWIDENGLLASILKRLNTFFLRRYSRVIVLDRFMRETINHSGMEPHKISVCSLWPTVTEVSSKRDEENSFINEHGLQDKCVIMYSGNHSICHPLDTLLQVAYKMRGSSSLVFVFVGGGARFSEVAAFKSKYSLTNIIQIGYQPVERLPEMLSAATLHVVTMGERYVGLVHPSKIYNISASARPVLYIGPKDTPVLEVLDTPLSYRHGEVEEICKKIENFDPESITMSKSDYTTSKTELIEAITQ